MELTCQKCGQNLLDSPNGYITGCSHFQQDRPFDPHFERRKAKNAEARKWWKQYEPVPWARIKELKSK